LQQVPLAKQSWASKPVGDCATVTTWRDELGIPNAIARADDGSVILLSDKPARSVVPLCQIPYSCVYCLEIYAPYVVVRVH
jgi:hypothetical protein